MKNEATLSDMGNASFTRRGLLKTGARLSALAAAAALTPAGVRRALAQGSSPASSAMTTSKPNFVFICADNHCAKYAGFMGHRVVRTPHLDRIAARGAVFRNTYCGTPDCCPSRSGMISGVYGSDVNSFCNATPWDGSLPAWPALLRDAGYHTYATGKVDANDNFDLGFTEGEEVINIHAHDPDITAYFRRPLCSRVGERAQVNGKSRTAPHEDRKFILNALQFLRERRPSSQPWSLYCGTHMPLPPFVGLEKYFSDYLGRVDVPAVSIDELESLPFIYQQLRHHKNIATPIPEQRQRRARAGYFSLITEMDDYVGEIWKALEKTGQLENTFFIYTSDHGETLGEHGLWFKNNLFDTATHVPLVIAGPGIPAGVTVDTPVGHVDLIRTMLEWSGAKTHDRLRGHSLVPLMHGQSGDHPGFAYTENHTEGNSTGTCMIRKGSWKYVHVSWQDGMLYDLARDPGELHNLIADPVAKPKLDELRSLLATVVDPDRVTERAFVRQRESLDRLARALTPDQLLDRFRRRLGEGDSVELLNGYYGRTFRYTHKARRA